MKQKKQVRKVTKKHESGRSMIEMVGVLAVMGLITAAAFVLITSAMRSQKLSRADDDISALAAGVRLLYNNTISNGKTDFSGIDTAGSENTLKVLGFDSVKSPYGGAYTVAVDSGDSSKFTISFDTGDANTCAALKQRTWANGGTADCGTTTTGTGTNAQTVPNGTLIITFDDGK